MATYNGVNAAIIAAITPSTILDPGLNGGTVRCMVDTYVGLGTESSAETIAMCGELPVGARILDVTVILKAVGGTPDIGDAEDPDRYVDEATDNAVTRLNNVAGAGYEVDMTTTSTPDNQILVTLDAAVTASGIITVVVFYTVE